VAIDVTTTPAVGDATKTTDYARLRDNDKELMGAAAGCAHLLGGSIKEFIAATSETDLDEGWIAGCEIDGTHLAACEVILEVNVKRGPDGLGGSVTVTVDLFNVTTAAQIASSLIATVLSTTTVTHGKSSALTLTTGINRYKARIKVSDATKPCAAVARVVIRGS
jgi:hypothetical protein